MKQQFKEWIEDGNVIQLTDGRYTTQCSLYRNRFDNLIDLYKYFLKEFAN